MVSASSKDLKRILDGIVTPLSALKILKRPVETSDDLEFLMSKPRNSGKFGWLILVG